MPDDAPRPFDGLRILELASDIAGPYAGKLFVDAGAEVVKVEPPEGDAMRRWSAGRDALPEGEASPLFQYLNAGKQSIVLDPRDARDRARFKAFATRADVVIEDWGPGGLESRALLPDDWMEAHPALSIVRISPWGQTGPWARRAANEFTLQAASGSVEDRGLPDRFPVAAGGRLGDWISGSFAAVAALAAFRSARQTGQGHIADLSSFEAIIQCLTVFGDLDRQFHGGKSARSVEIPSIEPTADGHVGVCTLTGQQWTDFCSMIGEPELGRDPRFLEGRERMREIDFVQAKVRAWTRQHTTAEIVELCELLRIPVTPIGNGRELPTFDHVVEREIFQRAPGGFLQPRAPWRLESATAAPVGATPSLDEHREPLLRAIEKAPPARDAFLGGSDLPFASLRVVDLTAFWAGPYTTSILSDLGADVIKIESVQRPDGMRFAGAVRNDVLWEWSHVFHGANPGKRDVTLRLDHAEGVKLLRRLIADADIVIENFSVRVMPAFGLDDETVKGLNPRLIYVRMPAFGLDGPWRDRAGFAMTVEQLSGLAWVTGYDDMPLVVRGACDPLGSAHAVFAIGLALEERNRTGRGQLVEVPLVEPALAVAAEQVIEYSAHGVLLGRAGNAMPHAAPQGIFETARADERVALSVTNDAQWRGLCQAIGADDWRVSPELATHAGRRASHDALVARLSEWIRARHRDEVVEALLAQDVPASASIDNHALHPHPQLEARGFFQTLKHPFTGETRYPAFPVRFSGLERDLHRTAPPTLGQHNREVLQGELALGDDEIAALEEEQVIGTRPSFM